MPRLAANLSVLFTEVEFPRRFARAREAGFTGVECWFPYDHSPLELAQLLRENGLEQVLFNLPAGDWSSGERGIALLPGRVEEFRDGVCRARDLALRLGCRQLNCLAGIAPSGADPEELRRTLLVNLRFAAEQLDEAGIRLLVEPLNTRDVPGFYLHSSADALALIDAAGRPNIALQYDVYHMQIMEGDLCRTIAAHMARIGHIQIADNPGRHEPGSGEINYGFLLPWLDRAGYAGWVGCEYVPTGDTRAGLSWIRELGVA
jgi:hydroxypyruvate isomerase